LRESASFDVLQRHGPKNEKITEPGVTQLHAYGEKKIQETPVEIMAYFRIG